MDPRPVVLSGAHARLEPLSEAHAQELCAAGGESAQWAYLPRGELRSVEDARAWIAGALEAQAAGRELAFAVVSLASGRAVGSTRYLDVRREHCGLEIGWTWLSPSVQRTAVNTECKRLLFAHAFETLGALRVQLKTDARNERSQRAIERLGAVREGVLRSHQVVRDGFVRDTVMYSVTAAEWPAVRARLDGLLARG